MLFATRSFSHSHNINILPFISFLVKPFLLFSCPRSFLLSLSSPLHSVPFPLRYTLTEVIDNVKGPGFSGNGVNLFLAVVMYVFAVVLAVVQPLFTFLTALHLAVNRPKSVPGWVRHAVQLLNEWASLDVCCIAAVVLSSQIGRMAESMSESMNKTPEAGASLMVLSIGLKPGCFLGLLGGAGSLASGWRLAEILGGEGTAYVPKKTATVAPEESAVVRASDKAAADTESGSRVAAEG